VVLTEGETVLDAGCGSGILLPYLTGPLNKGGSYLGVDLLSAGLRSLQMRARGLGLSVATVQADLCRELPLADHTVASVIAHFSVYTVPDGEDRRRVYRELGRVLKPGGVLVAVNPTRSYHAEDIIRASLESLKNHGKPWRIKKFLVYPLTLRLGLKHIERQLRSGAWHGYAPGELRDEIEAAGFAVERSEAVYGGCGDLVVGRKP
jgi:ubiquinone/menaquinone biosynthesis C-methylase UbiE